MSIVTLPFILFIIFVCAVYFAVPVKYRWAALLFSSYLFYWLNSTWLLSVMFFATLVTFLCAKAISSSKEKSALWLKENADSMSAAEKKARKAADKQKTKRILTAGILIDLGMLLFLKYWNFFADTSNMLLSRFGVRFPSIPLLLPIGISFYTLQAIAYMTDVYRGKAEADQSLPRFMLFMSFFPQIIQGPIPRYGQLAEQLYEPHLFDYDRAAKGCQLIIWGWMKKIMIADRIAIPVNMIFAEKAKYSGLMILFGGICYGIQVYTDFSGGMDIVRGVSQILGIELELNFRQPYFSRSIEEFWRRWHITLGAWMRDYVFYPLSLSKSFANLGKKARNVFGMSVGKKIPSLLAMFIVYFLVGFWHGPNWKYIAYGLWNGFFIMSGILFGEGYETAKTAMRIDGESSAWKVFQMLRTFVICSLGRLFPRADNLHHALRMFKRLLTGMFARSSYTREALKNLGLDAANWILLLLLIIVLFMAGFLHERGVCIREKIAGWNIAVRWCIYLAAILALFIFGKYGPLYSGAAFIYEKF